MSGLTDETSETTEQTKINISPFLFAMMVLASMSAWLIARVNNKMEDNTNASN